MEFPGCITYLVLGAGAVVISACGDAPQEAGKAFLRLKLLSVARNPTNLNPTSKASSRTGRPITSTSSVPRLCHLYINVIGASLFIIKSQLLLLLLC